MSYFTHERIHPKVIKINDASVYMFLIEGEQRACLVDTGYGVGNLKEYVEKLTDKPIFVLNTHCHGDHTGGNGWFDEMYLNEADWERFLDEKDPKKRYEKFKNNGRGLFADAPFEDYAPEFNGEIKNIKDGDTFDLGGLTLECVLVPGHSKGSVCVLLKEERIMIYGDAVGRRLGLLSPGHPASMYLDGLKNLKRYDGTYDVIWRHHNVLTVPLDILDNIIECCEDIINGTDDRYPTKKGFRECYAARKINEEDPYQHRVDGKQGNIFYILENAR